MMWLDIVKTKSIAIFFLTPNHYSIHIYALFYFKNSKKDESYLYRIKMDFDSVEMWLMGTFHKMHGCDSTTIFIILRGIIRQHNLEWFIRKKRKDNQKNMLIDLDIECFQWKGNLRKGFCIAIKFEYVINGRCWSLNNTKHISYIRRNDTIFSVHLSFSWIRAYWVNHKEIKTSFYFMMIIIKIKCMQYLYIVDKDICINNQTNKKGRDSQFYTSLLNQTDNNRCWCRRLKSWHCYPIMDWSSLKLL